MWKKAIMDDPSIKYLDRRIDVKPTKKSGEKADVRIG
jgi:hypothetical protein